MPDLLKNMPEEAASLHRLAKKLLDEGLDEEGIYKALQEEGVTRAYAELILDNVLTDIRNRKDFFKMLVMGVFTIAGALLLNYLSYDFALRNGAGFMMVFWGLMVAGIIMLVQAAGQYRRLPRY